MKTEHSSHTTALSNGSFLQKKKDDRKTNRVLILKGIFCKTTYVCVLTYHIVSF